MYDLIRYLISTITITDALKNISIKKNILYYFSCLILLTQNCTSNRTVYVTLENNEKHTIIA